MKTSQGFDSDKKSCFFYLTNQIKEQPCGVRKDLKSYIEEVGQTLYLHTKLHMASFTPFVHWSLLLYRHVTPSQDK